MIVLKDMRNLDKTTDIAEVKGSSMVSMFTNNYKMLQILMSVMLQRNSCRMTVVRFVPM